MQAIFARRSAAATAAAAVSRVAGVAVARVAAAAPPRVFARNLPSSATTTTQQRCITSWVSKDLDEWKQAYSNKKRKGVFGGSSSLLAEEEAGEEDENDGDDAAAAAGEEVRLSLQERREISAQPRMYEFERVVEMRRVSKVTTGGKMLRFRCTIVCGNEAGVAGFGVGKGQNVVAAVKKARSDAENNFSYHQVPPHGGILYEIRARVRRTIVHLWSRPPGSGLQTNMVVGSYLQATGIRNCAAKVHGSHNPLNTLLATRKALASIVPVEDMALMRGKKVVEL